MICPNCGGEGTTGAIEIGACPETGWVDYARVECSFCGGRGGFGPRVPLAEMAVTTGTEEAAE